MVLGKAGSTQWGRWMQRPVAMATKKHPREPLHWPLCSRSRLHHQKGPTGARLMGPCWRISGGDTSRFLFCPRGNPPALDPTSRGHRGFDGAVSRESGWEVGGGGEPLAGGFLGRGWGAAELGCWTGEEAVFLPSNSGRQRPRVSSIPRREKALAGLVVAWGKVGGAFPPPPQASWPARKEGSCQARRLAWFPLAKLRQTPSGGKPPLTGDRALITTDQKGET